MAWLDFSDVGKIFKCLFLNDKASGPVYAVAIEADSYSQ